MLQSVLDPGKTGKVRSADCYNFVLFILKNPMKIEEPFFETE